MARVLAPSWKVPSCTRWFPSSSSFTGISCKPMDLTDRHVSLATRLRYLDTVITPLVCFAAGHRAIFKNDLDNVDVVFRETVSKCGRPTCCHRLVTTLAWNLACLECTGCSFVQQCSVRCWSVRCVEVHWNLAQYAANLPPDRWLSRILMWTCRGHHTVGRPRNTWDTTLQNFCRHQHLGNWRAVARDTNPWANLMPQFVLFCTESWTRPSEGHYCVHSAFVFTCALHGLPAGIQVSLHTCAMVVVSHTAP